MTRMTDLLDRIPRDCLPAPGQRTLCAVSGGLDSMCLLDLLERWRQERGGTVFAAHFNHCLREAADRDEAFVRDFCARRGIPLTVGRGDVAGLARREGRSTEEAARILRYDFLKKTAEAEACGVICTAHHAGDSAETLLLNLIRGTGLRGLTGIPRQRDGMLRPLLDVQRGELAAYAAARAIPHVHDETNDDPDAAARNFLRLRVIPLLEELNPRAVEHMSRTAALLTRENEALEVLAEMAASNAAWLPGGGCTVFLDTLSVWPRAAAERMLLRLMETVSGRRRDFTARHVRAVPALGPGGSLSLPHGLQVRREGGSLYLERTAPFPPEHPTAPGETVPFGDWTVTLGEQAEAGTAYRLSLPENVPLAVTRWRSGDRLFLPGQRGARTLKRLCAEAGIPPWERDRLPVLRAGEAPAAVPGIGVDRAFSPQKDAVYVTFYRKNEEDGQHEK